MMIPKVIYKKFKEVWQLKRLTVIRWNSLGYVPYFKWIARKRIGFLMIKQKKELRIALKWNSWNTSHLNWSWCSKNWDHMNPNIIKSISIRLSDGSRKTNLKCPNFLQASNEILGT